jgi:MFS family permease
MFGSVIELTRERSSLFRELQPQRYDRKKLFAVFLLVITASVIDLNLNQLADMIKDFAVSFWGVALFVAISAIYSFGLYFILAMVKAKIKEGEKTKRRETHFDQFENIIVTVVQYVLIALIVSVVLETIFATYYSTNLLTVATTISYGFAVYLVGLLSYRLFSWFKRNKSLVVLLYGLAASMISLNFIVSIIFFDVVLLDKPPIITPQSEVIYVGNFDPSNPIMFTIANIQAVSYNGYFVLTWAGTILLLRHNIQRIGKVKFWALVAAPIIFFMSFYIPFYQAINPSTPAQTPLSLALPLLLLQFSVLAAATLFAMGFRSIASALGRASYIRDYMIITGYGFILFFTGAAATMTGPGYPAFGLASISLVGPSSFLILTGLYRSAVSVAEDAELRRSIKISARKEGSNLLDSIGTAEMKLEAEQKVMAATRASADLLTKESGVEPSMTDVEVQDLINQAMKEIREKKH